MAGWLAQLDEVPLLLLTAVLGVLLLLDTVPGLGLLIPADVAVLTATAAGDPADSPLNLAAIVAGTLAGWSLSFLAGRLLGRRLRSGRFGRWVGEERWTAAEGLVSGGGGRVVMAAPFLPVINTLVPIAAGGLRMPYRTFLRWALVGSALWGALYVALGLAGGLVGDLIPDGGGLLGTVLVALPGLVVGWVVLARVRRRLPSAAPAAVRPCRRRGRRGTARRAPAGGHLVATADTGCPGTPAAPVAATAGSAAGPPRAAAAVASTGTSAVASTGTSAGASTGASAGVPAAAPAAGGHVVPHRRRPRPAAAGRRRGLTRPAAGAPPTRPR
jgi:membrane protein DedA with SNARE-associated domain